MNCPKAMGPCPTGRECTSPTVKPQVTSAPQPLATYTRVPSGSAAMPRGDAPTGTVATTVFAAVSTTETVPSNDVHAASAPQVFATYARLPATATPLGEAPTRTVATVVFE